MSKAYIECLLVFFLIFVCALGSLPFANAYDGPLYDSSAYIDCKNHPEKPLYNGGILRNYQQYSSNAASPSYMLHNLSTAYYTFSVWVMIEEGESALIRVGIRTGNAKHICVGNVIARKGCWSFLKGGFVLDSPLDLSVLFFQEFRHKKDINIIVSSLSLQPFTTQQWRLDQEARINQERKRFVTVHVSNLLGKKLKGAKVTLKQMSRDFPIGSAIADTILGNLPYQKWFLKRFNAAAFENELKWYATEPEQGKTNYSIADKMVEFVRANQIIARGHNIFWEDPRFIPAWAKKLTNQELRKAVHARVTSLLSRYREEFIHWDVNNEMLHFQFYEKRLGANATLDIFKTANKTDPLAAMFMNDYNVIETQTCNDSHSTADAYINKLKELKKEGVVMDGIGLEAHFREPNPPLIRAVLDKLGALGLPIWLTEIDIFNSYDKETQAVFLEEVLQEGYSHPSVNGLMLWTALHPEGCYRMCLTDSNFRNLPAGDVVDKLLKEWQTGRVKGVTDEQGSFIFHGFLGEYSIQVKHGNRTTSTTFSLAGGHETRFFNIQL